MTPPILTWKDMHLLRFQKSVLCSWLWGFYCFQGGYLAVKYGQGSTSELLLMTVSCYKVATPNRTESFKERTDDYTCVQS